MALSGQKPIRGCGRRKRMIWIKEGNIEIAGTVEEKEELKRILKEETGED